MDFGSYPPEVNSARMYTGPGAGPLTVAAQAWTTLAGELQSTAESYRSVIAGLTSSAWTGPSSESMSTAAESFEQWLNATAAAAEETGAQARSASAAYQTAFAAMVPPPVIAQNRSLLAALIATDLLGRNTHAIAATEAQYAEMWAQDSAAMSSYAATSATATRLTAFTPPQPTTTGDSAQSAAVGQAAGTAAGDAQSTIQQAFSAVPSALQAAATAPSLTDTLDTISNLISIFVDLPANLAEFTVDIPLGTLGIVSLPLDVVGALTGLHTDDIVSGWNGEQGWPGTDPAPVKPFPAPLLNLPSGSMPTPKTVAAGLGDSDRVGQLAVPPTWTVSTPAVKPMSVTLPALPAVAAGETPPRPSGGALSEMALAGMAGRAMAGTVGGAAAQAPRPRAAAPSPPESPAPDKPRAVTTGVAAELREFTKLRDEGILTEEEYVEQKNRLLGR